MEKLLRKLALSFSTTTNVEFDDLLQEANLAYLEAMRTYDPSRGAITTHIWFVVSNHLKTYILDEEKEKCKRYGNELCSIEDAKIPVSNNPFWENLNQEAQTIAKVIFQQPIHFLNIPKNEVQVEIAKTMLEKGMNLIKIKIGLKNLRLIYGNN